MKVYAFLFIHFYAWGVFAGSATDLFWSLDSHYIDFFCF